MLTGADFTGAKGLEQDQLDEACGDGGVRLPPGLSVRACNGLKGARFMLLREMPKPPAPPKPPKY